MRALAVALCFTLFALACGDSDAVDAGPDAGIFDAGPPVELIEEDLALRHGGRLDPDARWDLGKHARPNGRFSLSFILRVDERPAKEALVLSRWARRARSYAIGFTDDQDITFRLSVDGRRALLLRADRHLPLGQEVLVTVVFSPREHARLYLGAERVAEHMRNVPSAIFDPPRVPTSFGGVRGVVRELFITPKDLSDDEVKARAQRWALEDAPRERRERVVTKRAVSDVAPLASGVAIMSAGRASFLAPRESLRPIFYARDMEPHFARGGFVVNTAGFARRLVTHGPLELARLARVDAVDRQAQLGVGLSEGINGHRAVSRVALAGGALVEPLFALDTLDDPEHQPSLEDAERALRDFQFSPSGARFAFIERLRVDKEKLTRLWTSSLEGELRMAYWVKGELVGGFAWLDDQHLVFFDPKSGAYVALDDAEDEKRRFVEGPRPLYRTRLSIARSARGVHLLTSDRQRRVLLYTLADAPVDSLPEGDTVGRRGELQRFGPLGFPPLSAMNGHEVVFVGERGVRAAEVR